MRIKKKSLFTIYFLLFTFLIFPSILPLFRSDFFKMHDFTHVARLVELDKAIKDGHFPPCWSKDLGWGYGMPLFHFYAPLPYYLAELFHLIGFNFLNSIKIVFASTFFLGFAGMFLLAKKFWGRWGAFLAALAFVYSPYRAVDFYVRGALGELFAISIIPWVLWAITKVIEGQSDKVTKRQRDEKIIALTSLLLGLFLLSHTVLNLIALPFFLLFAAFYLLITKFKKKFLLRLIISFILGLGLASFFLIPAFFEKKFTTVDKLTTGFGFYGHHFLYFRQFLSGRWGYGGSVGGPHDGMSFHLGKIHLILASIGLIFSYFYGCFKKRFSKRELVLIFFLLSGLILAFLSTYKAKFIWDAFPLMAYIQFPWRFNSMIIVLVSFLAGGGCFYLGKLLGNKVSFLFLLASISLLLKVNVNYFRPQEYINPEDLYYTDKQRIKESMSGIIPDYIPKWVEEEPKSALDDFQIISANPQIEVIASKTQKLVLKVSTDEDSEIQLNRFYFPGWKLFIDKKEAVFDYQENNGIIRAILPPGSYQLELIFKNTAIRTLSNLISAISLLVILFLFFNKNLKFKKSR